MRKASYSRPSSETSIWAPTEIAGDGDAAGPRRSDRGRILGNAHLSDMDSNPRGRVEISYG